MELQTPKPQVKVFYDGKNISEDISKYIIGLTYSDKVEGESDTIDLMLEDVDGLWKDGWYPDKGSVLTVSIGLNGVFLDCGSFEIDQIQMSGPPDTVTIQGLAAGTKTGTRTKLSKAHENKTLKQIAQSIAQKHKLNLQGDIASIVLNRITQNNETDLHFLKRISYEYGYVFSIRNKIMTFMLIEKIEGYDVIQEIDKTDLLSYSLTDKTLQTYSSAVVKYHNPKTNSVSTFEAKKIKNADGVEFSVIDTENVLNIHTKAENNQQAELKANAALYRANSLQQEGNIDIIGNAYMVAGVNFDLTGLGKLSGKFHVMSSTHTIDRSGGWTTALDIKRVGFIVKSKHKSTKVKKPAQYDISVVK
jgi:uncharacterized protein